jgi:predicted metalloendopeptidase
MDIDKLNKPVDNEWYMSPQTVNAYYTFLLMRLFFQLFYKPYTIIADEAANYG